MARGKRAVVRERVKMGRPTKPPAERRDSAIMLRVRSDLRASIEAIAEQKGASISSVIEDMLEGYTQKWRRYSPHYRMRTAYQVVKSLREGLDSIEEGMTDLERLRDHLGEDSKEGVTGRTIDADLQMLSDLEDGLKTWLGEATRIAGRDRPAPGPNYAEVPSTLLRGGDHYALEVEGDSMIEAGIFDGDTVIIERCDTAENGTIVVALVDDSEVTLKRYFRRGQTVTLEPANAEYKPRKFRASRIRVQGKLVGMMRQY